MKVERPPGYTGKNLNKTGFEKKRFAVSVEKTSVTADLLSLVRIATSDFPKCDEEIPVLLERIIKDRKPELSGKVKSIRMQTNPENIRLSHAYILTERKVLEEFMKEFMFMDIAEYGVPAPYNILHLFRADNEVQKIMAGKLNICVMKKVPRAVSLRDIYLAASDFGEVVDIDKDYSGNVYCQFMDADITNEVIKAWNGGTMGDVMIRCEQYRPRRQEDDENFTEVFIPNGAVLADKLCIYLPKSYLPSCKEHFEDRIKTKYNLAPADLNIAYGSGGALRVFITMKTHEDALALIAKCKQDGVSADRKVSKAQWKMRSLKS